MNVAICGPSSGKSTLVSLPTLVNTRTQRQIHRDKSRSAQNNSIADIVTDSTIIDNSRLANNYLLPTIHTDLDHGNSNKTGLRNISDNINTSEGADGSSVLEETYTTANEGALIDITQLVDRNILTHLRLIQKRKASQRPSRNSTFNKAGHE